MTRLPTIFEPQIINWILDLRISNTVGNLEMKCEFLRDFPESYLIKQYHLLIY